MKEYSVNSIRNIGLVGHGGVGKTTLSEALIYTMGETNRLGSVDDGTTVSDYHQDEIERKISIGTSMLHGEWKDKKINIVDIPGYSDFMGGAKGALRVMDLSIVVIHAVDGIQVGTEQVWQITNEYQSPRLFFVNNVDHENSNFDKVLAELEDHYGNSVVAFQFPVNKGEGFNQFVDVLKMKLVKLNDAGKGKHTLAEIPEELKAKAEELRSKIVEASAESDEDLMEAFFENDGLTDEQLVQGLRKGILTQGITPVFCGSAKRNFGADQLLDFVAAYAPSPLDFDAVKGKVPDSEEEVTRKPDPSEPLCAFVFKTISEAHVGDLSLIRVYSGQLNTGDEVLNASKGSTEKIGQIYMLNGKNRTEVSSLKAGDMGALVKLKKTSTSDTLCVKSSPIVLDRLIFPDPVFSVAVTPKSRGDEDKISTGLHILHNEDPSFTIVNDPELHQTIISGQGDLHLKVVIQRLKERWGVEVSEDRPKVPYRETIAGKSDDKYRHKKQTGGAGQFAEVWMRLAPRQRGEGFEFLNEIKGGSISAVFVPAVEKGVKMAMENGPVAGYKVVDVQVSLYDGKEHPVDSKEIAFQSAGRECFRSMMLKAKPVLLEPIYDVEVTVPEDAMGDVMGDLSGRRGKIMGMDAKGNFQIIKAKVPQAELDQYATTLRSITSGRGIYSRSFSHYEQVPREFEGKIIEEAKKEKEEE